VAAGLVAGVLVFASLPPRGWWWAPVIGLGVLSAVLAQASPRRRLLTGASTGLGWFGPGLAWVNGFSPPGYGLLLAVQVDDHVIGTYEFPQVASADLPAKANGAIVMKKITITVH